MDLHRESQALQLGPLISLLKVCLRRHSHCCSECFTAKLVLLLASEYALPFYRGREAPRMEKPLLCLVELVLVFYDRRLTPLN